MSLSPVYNIKHNPDRTLLAIPYSTENLAKAGGLLVHSGEDKSGLVHQINEESGLTNPKSGLTSPKDGLSETAQKIIELMRQDPTITYDEIASKLGKARSGIAKQIKKLIDEGVILAKEKSLGTWGIK